MFIEGTYATQITIAMNPIVPFIEIKPVFSQKAYNWQENVHLKVYMLLNAPMPMNFEKLSLTFDNSYYNQFCNYCPKTSIDGDTNDNALLHFEPMVMKCFEFNFEARIEDYGKQLEIIEITLFMNDYPIKVTFNWINENPSDNNKCFSHNSCFSSSPSLTSSSTSSTSSYPPKFYHITPTLTTFLEPRKPKVDLSLVNASPALLHEMYPIKIIIENKDEYSIKDISLTIVKMEESAETQTVSFILDGFPLVLGTAQKLTESMIDPGTSLIKIIHLPISDLNSQRFMFSVLFSVNSAGSTAISSGPNLLKEIVSIQAINPFNISFTTCTPLNTPSRVIRLMEPFVLKADITCLSPFPLELIDCNVELNQNIFHTLPYIPTTLNKLLRSDDRTECHFALYSESQITQETGLGVLVIRWRKSTGSNHNSNTESTEEDGCQINKIKFTLPAITVQNSYLYVETKLPEFGTTRESLLLTYNLANRTDDLLPLSLSLDKSDNFMFAGNCSVKFSIPAKSQSTQLFVLYPLVCGHVSLPKLKIILYPDTENPIDMDNVLEDIVPSYLLVMPQRKIYTPFEPIGNAVLTK